MFAQTFAGAAGSAGITHNFITLRSGLTCAIYSNICTMCVPFNFLSTTVDNFVTFRCSHLRMHGGDPYAKYCAWIWPSKIALSLSLTRVDACVHCLLISDLTFAICWFCIRNPLLVDIIGLFNSTFAATQQQQQQQHNSSITTTTTSQMHLSVRRRAYARVCLCACDCVYDGMRSSQTKANTNRRKDCARAAAGRLDSCAADVDVQSRQSLVAPASRPCTAT